MGCGYEDNYEVCTRCKGETRDIFFSDYNVNLQMCEDCLEEAFDEALTTIDGLKDEKAELEKDNENLRARLRKLKWAKTTPPVVQTHVHERMA